MDQIPSLNISRPSVRSVLTGFNLFEQQNRAFWLLQLGGIVSFLLWVLLIYNLPTVGLVSWLYEFSGSQSTTRSAALALPPNGDLYSVESYAKAVAVDTWFALVSIATIDAFAVVINFDRGLIVTFHRSVSLRMTMLATILSIAVYRWQTGRLGLNSHGALTSVLVLIVYHVAGRLVDSIKRPRMRRDDLYVGSLQQYCETIGHIDISWQHAALLTSTVVLVALVSTTLLPNRWSGVSVFLWVVFEALFLTIMKAKRTPRYIILSGPILLSIACVKWGLEMVSLNPRLTMKPEYFVALFISGRMILDLHLRTVLRSRHDLQWARKTTLAPTRIIICASIALLLLNTAGLNVITYIKPIMVVLSYGMSCLVIQTPAIYNVIFERRKTTKHE